MKKIITVMIVAISVLLLGNFFYSNNKIVNTKKDVKENIMPGHPTGIYRGHMWIYKLDEEGYPLHNVRFELKSRNDRLSLDSYSDYYGYYIDDGFDGADYYEDVYSNLTGEQKQLVESVHTIEDYENVAGSNAMCAPFDMFSYVTNPGVMELSGAGAVPEVGYCYLYLPTYLVLEETRVPDGYAKEKVLVPGLITVGFRQEGYESIERNKSADTIPPEGSPEGSNVLSNNLQIYGMAITNGNPYYMIKYGEVDRNLLLGTDIEAAANVWNRNYSESECSLYEEPFQSSKLEPDNSFGFIPSQSAPSDLAQRIFGDVEDTSMCLVNHKGKVQLTAKSTVDNVESVTTNINQQLEYRVVVKNTGDVDAIDNKIRSTLPEGFVYVDGTANYGGVYNNGAIEWEVDRIKTGEDLELTFKAYAPKGVNVGNDYVGTTSVETFDTNQKVEANKTMVRLSLQNPKTGVPMYILVLIVMIAFAVSLVSVQQYLNGRQQGQQG